ncbi:MAG: nitroreductase family protein [Acidobacteria bacterium]|nr:nitroreductase family protein [Acidobacteriota bacterium]
MDCIQALKTRRSVRAYTGEPVSRETIEDIVDCGRLAATARNLQPWEFVVVAEPAALRAIAVVTDYGGFIAQAAACIVVLCKDTKYYLEDGCNASQNILVAAWAHGLGACWVAGDKKAYAEAVRRMVGAPEGYNLVSLLAIGHPAEEPRKEKRPLAEVLHWERF